MRNEMPAGQRDAKAGDPILIVSPPWRDRNSPYLREATIIHRLEREDGDYLVRGADTGETLRIPRRSFLLRKEFESGPTLIKEEDADD